MEVRLRIEEPVRWYHHLPYVQLVVKEGATVGTLVEMLGVELAEGVEFFVNGRRASLDARLSNGDSIVVRQRGEADGAVSD